MRYQKGLEMPFPLIILDCWVYTLIQKLNSTQSFLGSSTEDFY